MFRKFGNHWFNLNSTLDEPEYLSQTYISLFIEQLKQEGYSIFVVRGELPQSEAELLSATFDPSSIKKKPPKKKENSNPINWITRMQEQILGSQQESQHEGMNDDEMMQQVLALSRQDFKHDSSTTTNQMNDDDDLEEAIRKSLQEQ